MVELLSSGLSRKSINHCRGPRPPDLTTSQHSCIWGLGFQHMSPKGRVQAVAVTLGKRQAAEGRDCLAP